MQAYDYSTYERKRLEVDPEFIRQWDIKEAAKQLEDKYLFLLPKNHEYPIRIAQVIGNCQRGGVEAVVFNYYRHIDHRKIQFDFYATDGGQEYFPKDIIESGARVFWISYPNKIKKYINELKHSFTDNNYTIVHVHMNALSVFALYAAFLANVPTRICHSHSTASWSEGLRALMKYILRPLNPIFATHLFACSEHAGKWMYGKRRDTYIMRNAIDTERFRYSSKKRCEIRQKYGIPFDAFVVGHVGRFVHVKNHHYLIDIFAQLVDKRKDAWLMLVGNGELMGDIKSKVTRLGLASKAIFAGSIEDTSSFYSAMDVFCLPSRFEGLAIVRVEAILTGCPCVTSINCPELSNNNDDESSIYETKIKVDHEALSAWVDRICRYNEQNSNKVLLDTLFHA